MDKIITVQNAEEEAALGKGWAGTPAAFEPYTGPPQRNAQGHDVLKWVDQWLTGSSSKLRDKIKAQLLRADARFWRSPDDDSALTDAMRQAFTGIAKVLAEAGILTQELLNNQIAEFVWDAAMAAGWYRFASETPDNIFPEQLGRYWAWRDAGKDWENLFYSEQREWQGWLFENPPNNAGKMNAPLLQGRAAATNAPRQPQSSPEAAPAGDSVTASGDDTNFDFSLPARRIEALAAYAKHWACSEASLARTARVDPSELSKWKNGQLPSESDKKKRIELALKNNQPPTPAPKRSTDS